MTSWLKIWTSEPDDQHLNSGSDWALGRVPGPFRGSVAMSVSGRRCYLAHGIVRRTMCLRTMGQHRDMEGIRFASCTVSTMEIVSWPITEQVKTIAQSDLQCGQIALSSTPKCHHPQ